MASSDFNSTSRSPFQASIVMPPEAVAGIPSQAGGGGGGGGGGPGGVVPLDMWKAVGSPARRQSVSVPQTPDRVNLSATAAVAATISSLPQHQQQIPQHHLHHLSHQQQLQHQLHHQQQQQQQQHQHHRPMGVEPYFDSSEAEDLVLSRKRSFRARAASTPNSLLPPGGVDMRHLGQGSVPEEEDEPVNPNASSSGVGGWNSNSGAVQWGAPAPANNSIWKDSSQPPSMSRYQASSGGGVSVNSTNNGNPGLSAPSPQPSFNSISRQYRSLSFSVDKGDLAPQSIPPNIQVPSSQEYLAQAQGSNSGDNDSDEYFLPKARSRSKSAVPVFGDAFSQYSGTSGLLEDPTDVPPGFSDNPIRSIWQNAANDAPMMHRRASTQPVFRPTWDGSTPDRSQQAMSLGHPAAPPIPNAQMQNLLAQEAAANEAANRLVTNETLAMEQRLEQYRQQRRYSYAPNPNLFPNDFGNQLMNRPQDGYNIDRRRHSVAGPYVPNPDLFLANQMGNMYLDASSAMQSKQDGSRMFPGVNEFFDSTDQRPKSWVEPARVLPMIPMQPQQHPWPLYVIEFKAGRTDYFFLPDPASAGGPVKTGDLVIVEADRGKDLGKVICDSIMSLQQLSLFQSQHPDSIIDAGQGGQPTPLNSRDVHPKRIFRLALPAEISMLVSKSQDEAKAMGVCQSKIRQKNLPMEVVDAEYQWDRRKLTFFFVADRRIDFRELVRDLFKLYKTRIWMCAVNPAKLGR